MSDKDNPLEFSALDLMPDWVKEPSKDSKPKYHDSEPREPRRGGSRRGNDRGGRGGGFQGDRRGGGGRDDRQGGGRGDRDRRGGGGYRNDRGRDRRGGGRGDRNDRRGGQQRDRGPVLKNIETLFEPTEEATRALGKHITDTMRTYPIGDLAKMVVESRDRYQVKLTAKDKNSSFYQCKHDGSTWLSRDEAVRHFLNSDGLKKYYQVTEVDVDPPKGAFSNIAVCGFSGAIL
ncbi:MAG: hypothetical protein AAF226_19820, partial [Verrucomicrobiota bacterium]